MADLLIHDARVLDPVQGVVGRSLLIQGSSIVAINPDETLLNGPLQRVDAGGRLLTPGLIDLHIHGIERHLFETGADDLIAGVKALAAYGVTTVLPTLYRNLTREHLAELRSLADALAQHAPLQAPGFHLEGPFLRIAGAGGLTFAGDLELLDGLLDALGDAVAAMSISPDTANIVSVIERLVERGVKSFITHTGASVDQTIAAIEAGACHATHFYDVFQAPKETDPGVRPVGCVETVLASPQTSVDFIPDGVHVHPMAIRAALAAKGPEGIVAITDANIGAGLGEGVYDTPWGFPVRIAENQAARIHLPGEASDGTLAGSALTMPQAIANLRDWLDLPEHEVWGMATSNPARLMGWDQKGRIAVGFDADLVLWNQPDNRTLQAGRTWSRGQLVFENNVVTGSTS